MLMCEFLTAVHHKLPVKVVVYNNSAFGLISFEAESVGHIGVGFWVRMPYRSRRLIAEDPNSSLLRSPRCVAVGRPDRARGSSTTERR